MRHSLHALAFAVMCLSCGTIWAQADQQTTASKKSLPAFPCYAEKSHVPRAFQGFWNWEPNNDKGHEVEVTIEFTEDTQVPLPCVGEPLEITVPNGQKVVLKTKYFDAVGSCPPTVTVTPANTDLPISDILSLVSKIGILSLPGVRAENENEYHLPPFKNKILTITSACEVQKLKFSQTVKITYQNPPRVAVSGGILFAPGVRAYGISTNQTGIGAGGVVTTQNSLVVSGHPTAQVIPFGFTNIYYAGSRTLNLNAQLGVGANPNLSSTKVEFFASPVALGWHDLYISPGFHIGQHEQLTGGFTVGELTPNSLSKPPIRWEYFTGFSLSVSYNLKPLVKSSSSK